MERNYPSDTVRSGLVREAIRLGAAIGVWGGLRWGVLVGIGMLLPLARFSGEAVALSIARYTMLGTLLGGGIGLSVGLPLGAANGLMFGLLIRDWFPPHHPSRAYRWVAPMLAVLTSIVSLILLIVLLFWPPELLIWGPILVLAPLYGAWATRYLIRWYERDWLSYSEG